jgi:hypothetical protein
VALNPVTSLGGYRERASIAAAPAVPTDLPTPQATSPAVNVSAAPNNSRQTPNGTRAVIIDPQTDTVVYQSLDAYTGDVIEQVPAPALLRQLAYEAGQAVQALIQGKNPTTAMLAAMQKVDTTT